jgi:hypothetical protein
MSKREPTPEHPDWEVEGEFDYADTLSLPEWGWEFLRRNPDYRKSWENSKREFAVGESLSLGKVVEASKPRSALQDWGCLYSSAPTLNARAATVFWQPELCSKVLRMTALPISAAVSAEEFSWRDMACPSVLLRGTGHGQHVLFRDNGRTLQLAVHGADLREPVRLVVDGAPPPVFARAQVWSQRCFVDLHLTGKLVPSHFQRETLSPRLKQVLRTLIGVQAGASHREIAQMLFGRERVAAEWCARGRPLRYKVRRTVHRGYDLMEGGYRKLLR